MSLARGLFYCGSASQGFSDHCYLRRWLPCLFTRLFSRFWRPLFCVHGLSYDGSSASLQEAHMRSARLSDRPETAKLSSRPSPRPRTLSLVAHLSSIDGLANASLGISQGARQTALTVKSTDMTIVTSHDGSRLLCKGRALGQTRLSGSCLFRNRSRTINLSTSCERHY